MNKSKIALTIFKLFGIVTLLTIALITIILIEGLQLITQFIQSLTTEYEPIKVNLLLKPVIPIKFPNSRPKWAIDLLPKEYLNIKHLKAWAKQLKIKNYSKLTKSKLILALTPVA
jgi:hypothetical protein